LATSASAVAAEQQAEAQHEIWGTPYYVAPERLNNEPEDVRSDIYSLGATLFHALAGRPPIEGESTSATELRRLKSAPPNLQTIAPDVSRETARVLNRTLAPVPADRYASYEELIADLERAGALLSGVTTKRRSRGPWIAAVIVLLLALVAGGVYVMRTQKAAPVTPAAAPTPDNTAALETRYQQARRQIVEGKYDAAATALTRLATESQNRQPLLNWIRFHAGVASLLQGKAGPAREQFLQVERGGAFSASKTDTALATFFVESAQRLAAAEPLAPPVVTEANLQGADSFFAFAAGLKNWQLGKFAEAAAMLEAFTSSQPTGEFAWINDYKPIAAKHLADYRAFAQWVEGRSNSRQRRKCAARLRSCAALRRSCRRKALSRSR
jgi:tetratricopeptide (TPR) repeat protein